MGHHERYKYKDIQLPQLRSFCVAATEGNFTAAAAALGLSVSAVWAAGAGPGARARGHAAPRRGARWITARRPAASWTGPTHVSGIDSLARLFRGSAGWLAERWPSVATRTFSLTIASVVAAWPRASRSRARTCCQTADTDRPSAAAAAVKFPSVAATQKLRKLRQLDVFVLVTLVMTHLTPDHD